MSDKPPPNNGTRRRMISRAKRLDLDARALQRRIERSYEGADHLINSMRALVAQSTYVANWLVNEKKNWQTVRYR